MPRFKAWPDPDKKPKKANKYHNRPCTYNGDWFQSERERDYCMALDFSKKAIKAEDRVLWYLRQVPYDLTVNGVHVTTYILDFFVQYLNRSEHIDVKGVRTETYKHKRALMLALHNITIIEP